MAENHGLRGSSGSLIFTLFAETAAMVIGALIRTEDLTL